MIILRLNEVAHRLFLNQVRLVHHDSRGRLNQLQASHPHFCLASNVHMESGTYSAERPQLAKLDEPTQARIRSTQILTTLPQIVSELVQNSLDAKANNISVSVNCAEWMCWVRDDGSGFSKQDLETFSEEDASQRYCKLT